MMRMRAIPAGLLAVAALAWPASAVQKSVDSVRKVVICGNRVTLDGDRGQILYRSSGDLDSDGVRETVLSVLVYKGWFGGILVVRPGRSGPRLVAAQGTNTDGLRSDFTDINGDGKLEIVMRAISGDGHWHCRIYRLIEHRLSTIGQFGDTRFKDLSGDGVPEVLSKGWVSFGFVGDHWLTIYKWNGKGYTDVSRRFPREYDAVIKDLKQTIYRMRYTSAYGSKHEPENDREIFGDLYYHLGLAYEYRGLLEKAKIQYAIAYRLQPNEPRNANAFARTRRPPHP